MSRHRELYESEKQMLKIRCPYCSAFANQWCVTSNMRRASQLHQARFKVAVSAGLLPIKEDDG